MIKQAQLISKILSQVFKMKIFSISLETGALEETVVDIKNLKVNLIIKVFSKCFNKCSELEEVENARIIDNRQREISVKIL